MVICEQWALALNIFKEIWNELSVRIPMLSVNDEWEDEDDLKPKFDTAKLDKKAAEEAAKVCFQLDI